MHYILTIYPAKTHRLMPPSRTVYATLNAFYNTRTLWGNGVGARCLNPCVYVTVTKGSAGLCQTPGRTCSVIFSVAYIPLDLRDQVIFL